MLEFLFALTLETCMLATDSLTTVSGESELQGLINEWNELKRIMEVLGIN